MQQFLLRNANCQKTVFISGGTGVTLMCCVTRITLSFFLIKQECFSLIVLNRYTLAAENKELHIF